MGRRKRKRRRKKTNSFFLLTLQNLTNNQPRLNQPQPNIKRCKQKNPNHNNHQTNKIISWHQCSETNNRKELLLRFPLLRSNQRSKQKYKNLTLKNKPKKRRWEKPKPGELRKPNAKNNPKTPSSNAQPVDYLFHQKLNYLITLDSWATPRECPSRNDYFCESPLQAYNIGV
jgi:hypothetical protein